MKKVGRRPRRDKFVAHSDVRFFPGTLRDRDPLATVFRDIAGSAGRPVENNHRAFTRNVSIRKVVPEFPSIFLASNPLENSSIVEQTC